jgi:hypothetical protein
MAGTWSYDPSLSTAKDRIRLYVGDTIESLAFLYDEEIAGMLAITPDELLCAAELCESQAAQSAQLVDYSVGGASALRVNLSQRAQAFAARAKTLRQRAALTHSTPFAGGLTRSGKQTQEQDTDRVRPAFTLDRRVPRPEEDLW